jgi:1,2-phenylacetyl-CoA epoxidase PaaB subunit
MSKIREQIEMPSADAPIEAEPLGDQKPYVVFTQLKKGGPHIYAGWLEAADDEMAVVLAKEHYGQDQECVNIWAIERTRITSSDGLYALEEHDSPVRRTWIAFTQKKAGGLFLEAGEVEADSADAAIESARSNKPQAKKAHCVWAVTKADIVSTQPDELIWRYTDQTYRLARGYTKEVKEKWKRFRAEDALREYEKEDLKEEF